jgi:hypothetical protein
MHAGAGLLRTDFAPLADDTLARWGQPGVGWVAAVGPRSRRWVGPDCQYNQRMKIEFDPIKNERNIRERDLSFERAAAFDFASATIGQDERKAYPEVRYVAVGPLDGRLHVLCFTPLAGGIRVISFRKANSREISHHEQAHRID